MHSINRSQGLKLLFKQNLGMLVYLCFVCGVYSQNSSTESPLIALSFGSMRNPCYEKFMLRILIQFFISADTKSDTVGESNVYKFVV